MAKNKEEKTNVMRVFEQKKIAYTPHSYPHEEGMAVDGVTVAKSMGFDPAIVFKTLVARGASKQYYVFDVPVAENLDLEKGREGCGRKVHRNDPPERAAAAHGLRPRRLLARRDEEALPHGVPQFGRKPCSDDRLGGQDRLSGRACAPRPCRARARKICGSHR